MRVQFALPGHGMTNPVLPRNRCWSHTWRSSAAYWITQCLDRVPARSLRGHLRTSPVMLLTDDYDDFPIEAHICTTGADGYRCTGSGLRCADEVTERSSSAVSSWPQTRVTSCWIPRAVQEPLPTWLSSGAGGGSPSIRLESPSPSREPGLWVLGTPTTCSRDSPEGKQEGSGTRAHRALDGSGLRRHPPGLRLRARPAHPAPRHRQQRGD